MRSASTPAARAISTRSDEDIARERDYARRYLRIDDDAGVPWICASGAGVVADTAIVPRRPARPRQRGANESAGYGLGELAVALRPGQLTPEIAQRFATLTETFERTLRRT